MQAINPIVFISRFKVKEGRADDFRRHYQDSLPSIEAGKPGTLVQLAYENEDSTEVAVIRLFPDADALDSQLQGAGERSKKTYEFIEPVSIEIYGAPKASTIETMRKISGSGITVSVSAQFIGGFIR